MRTAVMIYPCIALYLELNLQLGNLLHLLLHVVVLVGESDELFCHHRTTSL